MLTQSSVPALSPLSLLRSRVFFASKRGATRAARRASREDGLANPLTPPRGGDRAEWRGGRCGLLLGCKHQVAAAVLTEMKVIGFQEGGGLTRGEAEMAPGADTMVYDRHARSVVFHQAQEVSEHGRWYGVDQANECGSAQGRFRRLLQKRRLGGKEFEQERLHTPRFSHKGCRRASWAGKPLARHHLGLSCPVCSPGDAPFGGRLVQGLHIKMSPRAHNKMAGPKTGHEGLTRSA